MFFIAFAFLHCQKAPADNSPGYTVAAYYFPNYHPGDARNSARFGEKWSEWELVKNARPRFPGHQQPKKPLWGYEDESDPQVMAKKIKTAAKYGIDAFIFDWYYYDDGPFLQDGLERGYLNAENNKRVKFALMWANHDWIDIHPASRQALLDGPEVLYPGTISRATWERMTDMIIERYFKHPSYWKIDGRPYFSIYDLTRFIRIFGGVGETRDAIAEFRRKVRAAGLDGLHLNAVVWGRTILPSEEKVENVGALFEKLGFDSVTSYVWIHHVRLPDFPQTDYAFVQQKYFAYAAATTEALDVPYVPNVSMGWDSSPRARQDEPFANIGYPFMATISGNTPHAFKGALIEMKAFLKTHPQSRNIFNINCWNEWTEGSYLEPDSLHGMSYLEAIREVFGR